MIDESRLRLYEQLLLLTLDDRKGTPGAADRYIHAITGAIIAELVLLGRIRIEQKKRKTLVQVADSRLTGDALLDECFQQIRSAKRPQSPATWIKRFSVIRRLLHRVAERLWLAGLLRKEERSVLLFFSRVVYPAQDPRTKIRLQQKLRSVLMGDDRLDERTHLALAVIRHTLLSRLLDRREQKARRRRIDDLTRNHPLAKAVREAIASGHAH